MNILKIFVVLLSVVLCNTSCWAEDPAPDCSVYPGAVLNEDESVCVCDTAQGYHGSNVESCVKCIDHMTWSDLDAKCVADDGWVCDDGGTVCCDTTQGKILSAETNTCVCDTNKGLTSSGDLCVCSNENDWHSSGDKCIKCKVHQTWNSSQQKCLDDKGWQCVDSGTECEMKCEKGYKKEDSDNCTACPVGTYSNVNNATACTPCPVGKYANKTGSSACKACPAGQYQDSTGQASCNKCPAGSNTNNETGKTKLADCVPCDDGYYASKTGTKICTACLAGTYSKAESSDSLTNKMKKHETCTKCPRGQYAGTEGSSQCATCESGYTTYTEGQTACEKIKTFNCGGGCTWSWPTTGLTVGPLQNVSGS